MEEKYLQLTDTIYKIISFFPEEDPLKKKIKEKALEIMENLVLIPLTTTNPHPEKAKEIASQTLKDIEVLKSYLRLGKLQGWLDSVNFLILEKEYDKIKEEIKSPKQLPIPKEELAQKPAVLEEISGRQKKIIEFLQEQGRAQVADLKNFFPQVSKRTLRRDFEDLLKRGKIIRSGEWNQIFYKPVSNKLDRAEPLSYLS